MFWSIIQALFIKIQANMNKQEKKKRLRIYDLLNAETKLKFSSLPYAKQRKKFTEKELCKEKGGIEQKNVKKAF